MTTRTECVTDGELAAKLLDDKLASGWCYREGPSEAGFDLKSDLAAVRVEKLTLVRTFGRQAELYARRLAWEGERVWQVRQIDGAPSGVLSTVVLYGEGRDGGFREGGQFCGSFEYPGLQPQEGACVMLSMVTTAADDGGPEIVRWVELRT